MSSYVENFKSKLDWAMPFQRTGKFPLDRTDLFASYADAVKYAAGNVDDPDSRGLCGSSYVGQIVTVFENDTVTAYKIEANRTLGQIGQAYTADSKSLVVANGVFAIKGYAEALLREDFNGLQLRIGADGNIEWFKPDTSTVSGLAETVGALSQSVSDMESAVEALKKGKVDKEDGKGLSSNDYTTAEKEKLAGISAGAQVNVIETVKVNGQVQTPSEKAIDITVPTKLSELTNDQEFITNTVSNLTNYYVKTETYSRTEVDNLLAAVSTMKIVKVDQLPTTNISTTTIYLVAKTNAEGEDVYDEYIYVENKWELIGNTAINLDNYLQKDGDGSDVTVVFSASGERSLPVSGESLKVILGKVLQYLTDLKAVAFTGSYNDLTDTPAKTTRTAITLVAGNTSTQYQITNIIAVQAYDAVSGEMVFVDQTITASGVTVSIAEAYTNDIVIVVTSLN